MRLRNPKNTGNINVIMRCCAACWGSIDGDCVIFC
jgi:hypothetical protein